MKNKMKRVLAFLLASIMVMASCMTVLAAESETPKPAPATGDQTTITVKNVPDGAVVTAYKIVKANYDASGFTGYSLADGVTADDIKDISRPTAAEIRAIADKISAGTLTLNTTVLSKSAEGVYSSNEAAAGKYVTIVSNVTDTKYNPILLSASYSVDNSTPTGPVTSNDNWTLDGSSAKARENAIPKNTDRETITVTNVKSDATVKAYQIVQPVYNDSGFVRYELVSSVETFLKNNHYISDTEPFDFENPSADAINAIAKEISTNSIFKSGLTETIMNSGTPDTTFTAEVGVGEYVVIASGASDVIYNPILLSVYYSIGGSDNTMTTDPVSANDTWNIIGTEGHVKSSEPEITKKITSPADGTNTDGHGSDAAVGDMIGYQIDATIPSYSAEYKEVEYIITDTLSETLEAPVASGITVKVGEDTVWSDTVTSNPAIKEVSVTGQVIKIEFTSDYILVNGGKTVSVTYSAKLKENASVNMDANTNGAKVEYSNDPSDKSKHAEKDDKTYVYTFELDGKITGKEVMGNIITHELIKVDENGNEQDQGFITDELVKTEVTNALAGATFTLTKLKEDGVTPTDVVYTANTDANGYFNGFTGLDAGKYVLKETAAPDGYTIDDKSHSVVISAEYNPNGTLKSYTILIDGTATSTYTAEYEGDTLTKITPGEPQTTYIQNTKLQNLPSTGGIGTYIFTVLGVALMVIAAVLYMRKRRQAQ